MDCRRMWAVDDDRSRRKWAVDEDRCRRKWAVDKDRRQKRCAVDEDPRQRRCAVDEKDNCPPLQWRDLPPHYPREDQCYRKRVVDDDRRREALRVAEVKASIDRIDALFVNFNRSIDRICTSAIKLSSDIYTHSLSPPGLTSKTDSALTRPHPCQHNLPLPYQHSTSDSMPTVECNSLLDIAEQSSSKGSSESPSSNTSITADENNCSYRDLRDCSHFSSPECPALIPTSQKHFSLDRIRSSSRRPDAVGVLDMNPLSDVQSQIHTPPKCSTLLPPPDSSSSSLPLSSSDPKPTSASVRTTLPLPLSSRNPTPEPALEGTETAFYEIISEKYPASPNHPLNQSPEEVDSIAQQEKQDLKAAIAASLIDFSNFSTRNSGKDDISICDGHHAHSFAEMSTNDVKVCDKVPGSGVEIIFTAVVEMPGLNSTDKADPTQCSQAVRCNVSEGFDPKFVISKDEVNVMQGDKESRSQAAHSQRQRGKNAVIVEVANVELLKIRGVGPKNLSTLVDKEFHGISQLKQLYKDKFYGECSQKIALIASHPTRDLTSPASVRKVLLDTGVIQTNALTVDHLASLEKYLETVVSPASILTTEVEWLKSIKANLLILDDVPVACGVAADAGILSVVEDLSHCEGYCPMPAFRDVIDVPLVRIHKYKSKVRKEFGIGEDVELFIINSGGQQPGWTLRQEWSPDLWLCLVCGASDKQVLSPNFIKLAKDEYTLDLVPASYYMIGKIGYGALSKALAYKLPFVFVKRDLLIEHWKPYLERALTLSPCHDGDVNVDEVTARILQNAVIDKCHLIDMLSGARRLCNAIALGSQVRKSSGRGISIPDWHTQADKELGLYSESWHFGVNGDASFVGSCFMNFEIVHGRSSAQTDNEEDGEIMKYKIKTISMNWEEKICFVLVNTQISECLDEPFSVITTNRCATTKSADDGSILRESLKHPTFMRVMIEHRRRKFFDPGGLISTSIMCLDGVELF